MFWAAARDEWPTIWSITRYVTCKLGSDRRALHALPSICKRSNTLSRSGVHYKAARQSVRPVSRCGIKYDIRHLEDMRDRSHAHDLCQVFAIGHFKRGF